MEISAQDKGKYLRGLLILIGKDHLILENEKNWFYKLSSILGYDKAFCKTILKELPENEFLIKDPPKFSNKEIAKAFIIDGIHLAFTDNKMHPNELEWINIIAEINGIDILYGMNEYEKFRKEKFTDENLYEFEIEKLLNKSY
ncbi:MAG: hypothetical protein N2321_04045 [Melioribacteraceae bacterium]|nr:hypothetical protein [Melioribacteraceae bacterium]